MVYVGHIYLIIVDAVAVACILLVHMASASPRLVWGKIRLWEKSGF